MIKGSIDLKSQVPKVDFFIGDRIIIDFSEEDRLEINTFLKNNNLKVIQCSNNAYVVVEFYDSVKNTSQGGV